MTDIVGVLQTLVWPIAYGAGAAAVSAAAGYLKAHYGPDKETFDETKFGTVVAVGALYGGLAAYYGVDVTDLNGLLNPLVVAAIAYFVPQGVKALVRFLRAKLAK